MNPYAKYLQLPEAITDPDYYQLLGIRRFTSDRDTVRNAALRQYARMMTWQNSEDELTHIHKILFEIIGAKQILLDVQRKEEYDDALKEMEKKTEPKQKTFLSTDQELRFWDGFFGRCFITPEFSSSTVAENVRSNFGPRIVSSYNACLGIDLYKLEKLQLADIANRILKLTRTKATSFQQLQQVPNEIQEILDAVIYFVDEEAYNAEMDSGDEFECILEDEVVEEVDFTCAHCDETALVECPTCHQSLCVQHKVCPDCDNENF